MIHAAVDMRADAPPSELLVPRFTARLMQGGDVITAEEWDTLSLNALEENPFLARRFVRACLLAFGQQGLKIVVIRDQAGRLAGILPYRDGGLVAKFAGREAVIALNCYQPEGVPLIDRRHAPAVLGAFLRLIASGLVPGRWVFPFTGLDGPFLEQLRGTAKEHGYLCHIEHRFDRPVLSRLPEGFEAHSERIIGRKRVKTIRRNLARLEELGSVRFERASERAHMLIRLEDFLRIEKGGWKGAAGTAFLSREQDARFARLVFGGVTRGEGITSIDSLLLDGQPIALSINVRTGQRIFSPKSAYDETYRKYAPGLLLDYLAVERFYAECDGTEIDAATTGPGHILEELWNGRRPMGTVIVGPDDRQTSRAIEIHAAKHRLWQSAKRLLRRD